MADPDRLRHLLLMLSSPYDGEIVTAAKAVGSFLKKEGSDWHDLVDRLTGSATAQPTAKIKQPEWEDLDAAEIAEQLLAAGGDQLAERERAFLQDMTWWNGEATRKQDHWLRAIAAKLRWRP